MNIILYAQDQHSTCLIELILYLFPANFYLLQFIFSAIDLCAILWHLNIIYLLNVSSNEHFLHKNCSNGQNIFSEILVLLNVSPNEHFPHKNCLNGLNVFSEIITIER